MSDGHDPQSGLELPIVNDIRESSYEMKAKSFAFIGRTDRWIVADEGKDSFHFRQEVEAQSGPLTLVVGGAGFEFCLGLAV